MRRSRPSRESRSVSYCQPAIRRRELVKSASGDLRGPPWSHLRNLLEFPPDAPQEPDSAIIRVRRIRLGGADHYIVYTEDNSRYNLVSRSFVVSGSTPGTPD